MVNDITTVVVSRIERKDWPGKGMRVISKDTQCICLRQNSFSCTPWSIHFIACTLSHIIKNKNWKKLISQEYLRTGCYCRGYSKRDNFTFHFIFSLQLECYFHGHVCICGNLHKTDDSWVGEFLTTNLLPTLIVEGWW